MVVEGRGLSVSMGSCVVAGADDACLQVRNQAKVSMQDCELKQSQTCSGAYVRDDGSELLLNSCKLHANQKIGACCELGATVRAERTYSCRNGEIELTAFDGGSMQLKHCSSDRDTIGFSSRGASSLRCCDATKHPTINKTPPDGRMQEQDAPRLQEQVHALAN